MDFAASLALGCLAILPCELAVTGGDEPYRTHVLALLAQALQAVK